ncbi:TPA: SEL1-like repeat protein [Enterobacter soli]|nr:SEL1-like repeat protein [Enterobacter soli]
MEELKSNSVSCRDYHPLYAPASAGDIDAQIELGLKYRDGNGVEQDGNKAVEWLTKAANQGSTQAKFNLGYMYKDGDGVPLNYSKAIEWFTLAADEGDMNSLVWIGILHQRGHGFTQDFSKAAECYSVAASKGDSYGQYNLGTLYRDGKGVPSDSHKALELFTLSAEQGNELALEALGELYIAQRDYEKGKEYLRRAGANGNQKALETLKKIEAVQEKHRIEDSVRKITCPFCGKKSVWKAKYCHGCTARILYSPARKYEWMGIGIAIFSAVVGVAMDPNHLGRVLFFSFLIWPLSLILSRLFGEQQAFFRKD